MNQNPIEYWKSRAEAAEAKLKEWTDNENGENYDFQIQGILLRQTVQERDEARSRAEAAEEDARTWKGLFDNMLLVEGKLRAEVARLEDTNASILYNIGELERIHKETVQQFRERVSEQLCRIAELETIKSRYVRHDSDCGVTKEFFGYCTCGLKALLETELRSVKGTP